MYNILKIFLTGFLIVFFIGCEEPVKEPLDIVKEPVDSIKPEPDDNKPTDSVKYEPDDNEPVIIRTDSTSAAERLFEKEVTLRLIEVQAYVQYESKPQTLLSDKNTKTNIVNFYTGNDTTGNKPLGMLEYGEVWNVECVYMMVKNTPLAQSPDKEVKNFYFYTDKNEYNRTLLMEPDHNNSYKKPFFEIYFNKEQHYKHQGVFSRENFTSTNLVFEQAILLNYKGKEVDYNHEKEYVEGSLDGAEYLAFKTNEIKVTQSYPTLTGKDVEEIIKNGKQGEDYERVFYKGYECVRIGIHYYKPSEYSQYSHEYFGSDLPPFGNTTVTYRVHYTLLFEITDKGHTPPATVGEWIVEKENKWGFKPF